MKILSIQEDNDVSGFELFLHTISDKLAAAICKKFHAYTELNDIYSCNSFAYCKHKIISGFNNFYALKSGTKGIQSICFCSALILFNFNNFIIC